MDDAWNSPRASEPAEKSWDELLLTAVAEYEVGIRVVIRSSNSREVSAVPLYG
jgi:hypothetical protein